MRLFHNATFLSCEDDNREFSVLAEKQGQIIYAGDVVPDFCSGAHPIDLGGKCVVPAFADTHIHFSSFSLFQATLDCRAVSDFEELASVIQQYITLHPSEKVILGFGCSAHSVREKRLPEKNDLDRISSKPLMLIKYDGHAAVGNTPLLRKLPQAVLKAKGFDPDTGWFNQDAFYRAVNAITRSVSLFSVLRNLIGGADYLARRGVGLVHAAEGVGFPLDLDIILMQIAALGLPQEFEIYFQTMAVRKVLKRKLPCIGGCFATALDGCFGSEDAALRTAYGNAPGNKGVLFYTQRQVDAFVKSAHGKGLQIAMHAIGDAAVEQALNAYEAALADDPRDDHRHIIIHADLMDPGLIERAADLKIEIALQTPFLLWRQEPMTYLENLLGNRVQHLIPLKSMLSAGLKPANGSDAPCTLPDPLGGIHAACNHPNPDERIEALDALKMHTSWAARLSFDENKRGTLTEGKKADFVVLDKHLLTVPPETIKDICVEALYLGGCRYETKNTGIPGLLWQCAGNKWLRKTP